MRLLARFGQALRRIRQMHLLAPSRFRQCHRLIFHEVLLLHEEKYCRSHREGSSLVLHLTQVHYRRRREVHMS